MNFLLALVSWYLALKLYGQWETEVRSNGRYISGSEVSYTIGIIALTILGIALFLIALL